MSAAVPLEDADGRRLLVMFCVEDRGDWLVWGTARAVDGELFLDTDEASTLVPLPGGIERLRSASNLDFAEDAELVTAIHVGRRPDHVPEDIVTKTGLRFDD